MNLVDRVGEAFEGRAVVRVHERWKQHPLQPEREHIVIPYRLAVCHKSPDRGELQYKPRT